MEIKILLALVFCTAMANAQPSMHIIPQPVSRRKNKAYLRWIIIPLSWRKGKEPLQLPFFRDIQRK